MKDAALYAVSNSSKQPVCWAVPSSLTTVSSIQSRGEYHRTKSPRTQPGLAALNASMSDKRQALCIRALSWVPSADVPSLHQININHRWVPSTDVPRLQQTNINHTGNVYKQRLQLAIKQNIKQFKRLCPCVNHISRTNTAIMLNIRAVERLIFLIALIARLIILIAR